MRKESIYWFIVLITFFYIILKNKNSSLKILIILCFYSGLAASFGKEIENPYKIVLILLSVYLLSNNNGLSGLSKREKLLLFAFILFSISFLFSVTVNGGYFKLVFSQYSKYVTPIFAYYIFKQILIKSPNTFINLNKLFFSLLTIQILLSVVKILTLGLQESVVGSLSYVGGGLATPLPVFGFILVWMHKQGVITKKDWLYISSLLLIGFASYKRAIWFIMPSVIFMFMYFVPKKISFTRLLYYLPLIPLIFYAGVRLNPSLNKEGKIGGSFDLQYTLNYAQIYSFGKTSEINEVQPRQGRGGAAFLLWDKLFNTKSLSFNDYWGFGLEEIYTVDYEKFDIDKFGISNKGAASGLFQSYIVGGYIGIFVTILLMISVLGLIKEPRIRLTIALLLFWDYFFYSGLILRTQALFILLFFIIIYSNLQFEQRLYRKYSSLRSHNKDSRLQPQAI
jgi:nitrate reductase NapE component